MNIALKNAFAFIISEGRLFKHTDALLAIDNLDDTTDIDALSVSIFGGFKIPRSIALPKLITILNSIESKVLAKPAIIIGGKMGFENTMRRALEGNYETVVNPFNDNELTNMTIRESTQQRDIRTLQLSNISIFFVCGLSRVVNPAYAEAISSGSLVTIIRT